MSRENNQLHADSDENKIRIQKVKELQEKGINPWPQKREVTSTALNVINEFKEDLKNSYSIAGRVVSTRVHGKSAFLNLLDKSGKIQVYIKEDEIDHEKFEFLKHYIDLGDIIWVIGKTFKTKTGEITLKVEDFVLLSKSLHPLPEKFHGLTDVETRYRQRYLDLISNPESRERFLKRSAIVSEIRRFMENHDYVEVETPMLHPIPGGAAAKPFITHHNALGDDFYLRIAPELYLKRLVVGGIERVFEINRNFRNEGVSTRHNPEFTMLEFYTAHEDYKWSMDFVEKMLQYVAKKTNNSLQLQYGGHTLDFSKFDRLSVQDAIIKYSDLKAEQISEKNIDKTIKDLKVEVKNRNASYGEKLFILFEEVAESELIQPTFIIDFPIETSPLAKRDPNNPEIASRFELFIAGMEIANSFTELNDPFDQAARFMQQLNAREFGDEEAHHFDQDFITSLEYGLPPTVGVGIGIDRLVMLMTNTTSIRDVILFPTLKKK
ncbi:lysine--tRNA ligase [candidate division TM6 bacterium RIFCSPHIGHO2_12_FULL_32_22]|nr:MAG: lysine--tRNA ligase [candidate division TM6 bacterium RIFCSPHIGHO2_12_FULL_32_22]